MLVVGAGVAGLAAIGTATSLGAITYAFDVTVLHGSVGERTEPTPCL